MKCPVCGKEVTDDDKVTVDNVDYHEKCQSTIKVVEERISISEMFKVENPEKD